MLVLTKNKFLEYLNGKIIVKKGGKYFTQAGIEVKCDEPIEEPKPKKTATKKVAEDGANEENE